MTFTDILKSLLKNTEHHLIMYINTTAYLNHSQNQTHIVLTNDQENTYSSVLLHQLLLNYKQKRCIFTALSDTCHSGNLWRIKSHDAIKVRNCISFSACNKHEHSTGGKFLDGSKCYWSHFCVAIMSSLDEKPNATHREIYKKVKERLKIFNQTVKKHKTNDLLMDYSLFIPD
jgi:hypothetical protein